MFGAFAGRRRAADGPAGLTAYDFEFQSIDGEPLKLSEWRGRALLVVNTASQCGFTQQYNGLQHLHQTYGERGLTVIAVPSNDFGGQEPGTEAQIKAFCGSRFNVAFPLTAKTQVVGGEAHPFYRWAARELGPAARPRWNFHKYLVARDGRLDDWFSTVTGPTSKRVVGAIERVLAEPT
ncbi:MAG: glutathione peroxidase [Proteobacteria bacterium]|nr:glutathione peroxidase [Pseudomonadota bacterium]